MINSLKKFVLGAFLLTIVSANIYAAPPKGAPTTQNEIPLLSFKEDGLTQGKFSIPFGFLGNFKLSPSLIDSYNSFLKIPNSDTSSQVKWKRSFYDLINGTYPNLGDRKKALCVFSIFENNTFFQTLNEAGITSLDKLPTWSPVVNELRYDASASSESGTIYTQVSTSINGKFTPILIFF